MRLLLTVPNVLPGMSVPSGAKLQVSVIGVPWVPTLVPLVAVRVQRSSGDVGVRAARRMRQQHSPDPDKCRHELSQHAATSKLDPDRDLESPLWTARPRS